MDQHVEKEKEEDGKVNWLALPDHLIASITDKFFLVKDYIRFGAVCRSWRCIYAHNLERHCRPRQLPLLMVPPTSKEEDYVQTRSLYSISDNAIIPNIKLLVPHDRLCRGSSEGWLITLNKNNLPDIRLLHPFSGAEIELPPATALPREEREFSNEGFIDKAILSADPSSNLNYFVMVIYGAQGRLALFKRGDPTWTPFDTSGTSVMEDVIYYRDRFYAVDFYGQVNSYGPHHPHPELVKLAQLPEKCMPMDKKKYLVDLDGELLLVARSSKWNEDEGCLRTCSVEVFKLKNGSCPTTLTSTWNPLQSLGGQALFLGTNSSMSLLASDFPGCRPDCIYFTDDDFDWCWSDGAHDIGLFNLADGTFEQHFPVSSNTVLSPMPIWIQPSPPSQQHSHH